MRFNKVKEIFRKEILDTLRDRRTILMMLVVPVLLYPGLLILVNELAVSQQAKMEQKTVRIALVRIPDDSRLIDQLRKTERIEIAGTQKPFDDVKDGSVHFVIEMADDASQALKENKTAKIRLHYDRSNEDAMANLDRIYKVIDQYESEILDARLKARNLAGEYVEPVDVDEINVASKQKMGGFVIGRFLPMLMVIMVLMGSLYPAIDMTAGEKERGTLETILTSPATRTEIVIGKFITVTIIALITGLLNLGSMAATFMFGIFKQAAQTMQVNIPPHSLLIMIACLLPLAIFFSGLMMAVSSFARSFKDAQNLLTPIYIAASVPALISSIPGIQLEGFWLTVPIANVVLLYKELMLGTFRADHILIVFFCTTFFASISLFVAIKLFGREEVLFGEASSLGLSFKRKNIVARPLPEPSEAIFFVMLALILLLYAGVPMQSESLIVGLIATQLVIFLAFPLAFAVYLKLDLLKTFSLRRPSPLSILMCFLLVAGIQLCAGTIMTLQNHFLPFPKYLLEMLEKLMKATADYPFPLIFLIVAVLPAICEELTFRGLVLSGLSSKLKPLAAVAATAALFAVFHLSIYRFLPTFLIGLAASYLVFSSRSIFPGMLLHMLNNGLIVFLQNHPQYDRLGFLQEKLSLLNFTTGLVLITIAVAILRKTGETPAPGVQKELAP